jgi:hypothetical protein
MDKNLTDEQLLELAEQDAQKLLWSDNKEQPAPEITDPATDQDQGKLPEDQKNPDDGWEQDKQPKGNIAKLLEQRNQARTASSEKDDIISQKDQEINTLQQELNELKAKELEDWEDEREHNLAIVEKATELTSAKREKKFLNETNDSKFFEETPEALEVVDELNSIKTKHPTLSTKEAYNHLLMKLWVTPWTPQKADKPSYDLLWTDTGKDQKSTKFEDMTTAQQEAYLIAQEGK